MPTGAATTGRAVRMSNAPVNGWWSTVRCRHQPSVFVVQGVRNRSPSDVRYTLLSVHSTRASAQRVVDGATRDEHGLLIDVRGSRGWANLRFDAIEVHEHELIESVCDVSRSDVEDESELFCDLPEAAVRVACEAYYAAEGDHFPQRADMAHALTAALEHLPASKDGDHATAIDVLREERTARRVRYALGKQNYATHRDEWWWLRNTDPLTAVRHVLSATADYLRAHPSLTADTRPVAAPVTKQRRDDAEGVRGLVRALQDIRGFGARPYEISTEADKQRTAEAALLAFHAQGGPLLDAVNDEWTVNDTVRMKIGEANQRVNEMEREVKHLRSLIDAGRSSGSDGDPRVCSRLVEWRVLGIDDGREPDVLIEPTTNWASAAAAARETNDREQRIGNPPYDHVALQKRERIVTHWVEVATDSVDEPAVDDPHDRQAPFKDAARARALWAELDALLRSDDDAGLYELVGDVLKTAAGAELASSAHDLVVLFLRTFTARFPEQHASPPARASDDAIKEQIAATLAYVWRMCETDDPMDPRGDLTAWHTFAGWIVKDLRERSFLTATLLPAPPSGPAVDNETLPDAGSREQGEPFAASEATSLEGHAGDVAGEVALAALRELIADFGAGWAAKLSIADVHLALDRIEERVQAAAAALSREGKRARKGRSVNGRG